MSPRPALSLGATAAELIRREIRRARGNEVCFLARIGAEGELLDPVAVARGHASAVLAAVDGRQPGGVVLHNHPSGVLDPSAADLTVAAQLWEQGFGFAIVDNDVEELYVVVEPPADRKREPLDLDALEAALAPGGPLAARHGSYEDRPQQRAMARVIGELYNDGGIGLVEAGTGTGKSVAYLLPAIRWALQNRERTVVSTNTINLQEQLVEKDLPLLGQALGEPFRYALVKGRQNYVSIRRALLAQQNAAMLLEPEKHAELSSLIDWLGTTSDGSLSDLPLRPAPEVWDEVESDSDVCLRARCPHFEQCFYQRARRDAAAADVLVVNHHLLFSDLAVRHAQSNYTAPAVLPAYKRLVLDEAHNLEDAATQHLGATVSRRGLFRVLRRLEHRGKGVLPTVVGALRRGPGDLLAQAATDLVEERLLPAIAAARERAGSVFGFLEEVLRAGGDSVVRLDGAFDRHAVWQLGLAESLEALLAQLATLRGGIDALRERIGVDEEVARTLEPELVELRGVANRLDAAADALRETLQPGEGELRMVRWMERTGDRARAEVNIRLAAAPLDLSGVLREALFEKVPTVLLTSATLAAGRDFRFIRDRLGIAGDRLREAVFASPFDFATQSLLVVPTDLPLPAAESDRRHDDATAMATLELARSSDGGIFVLFTSYRSLRYVAQALRTRPEAARWPLFVHGEAPRAQLVRRFAESGRGILLGTTSFWEGVDVPGRPLRALLIPRLPFKVPTEPVTAARVEAIEATGGNAFVSYMLPHAAIRLKQGFGRLIRSRADRGAVVILDGRIARSRYGRYLLAVLPPAPLTAAPWPEVRAALAEFYRAGHAPPVAEQPPAAVAALPS